MNLPQEEIQELFCACHCGFWDLKQSLAVYRVERLETNLQTEKFPCSNYVEGRTWSAKGPHRGDSERPSVRLNELARYKKQCDVAMTTVQ